MSHQKIDVPALSDTIAKMAQMEQGASEQPPEAEATEEAAESSEEVEAAEQETPAEEPESEDKEEKSAAIDDAISARFAKIAEKEREFRQTEKRVKEQQELMEKRLQELEAKEKKLANPDNLLEVLDAMGMSVDEFQRKVLLGDVKLEKPEVDPIQQKLQELEAETKRLREWEQTMLQREQAEASKKRYNDYLGSIAEAAPRYENLGEYFDSTDEIVSVARQQAELYAAEYNEAPEIDDLLSQLDTYYGKELARLRKKLTPAQIAERKEQEKAESTEAPKKKPSRTLKNSDTQTAANSSGGGWTAMDVATGKISMDQWAEYQLKKFNQQ